MLHEIVRRIARGKLAQTDYETATDTAQPTNFVKLLLAGNSLTKHSTQRGDNRGDSHGYEQATEDWAVSHDAQTPVQIPVSSQEIGFWLLMAFGGVTTTQPNAGTAPLVYQHVFREADISSNRQLLALTLLEVLGVGLSRKLPSMCVGALSMGGDGLNRIVASAQLIGSGKVVEPAGLTAAQIDAQAPAAQSFFHNSQAALTLADAGTLANPVTLGTARRFESWNFGFNNNPLAEDGYRPGAGKFLTANDPMSGAVRSELLTGIRSYELSFLYRFLQQSEELTWARMLKKLNAKIELTGGVIQSTYNHKLTVEANRVPFTMAELGSKNGLVTSQITCDVMRDPAQAAPVTVTLINNVPSYTV